MCRDDRWHQLSTPITVNGFQCKNCTDVDYAKKHIDPAHPRSGPYGIDAKDDPTKQAQASSAVVFAGGLNGLNKPVNTAAAGDTSADQSPASAIGRQLDLSA